MFRRIFSIALLGFAFFVTNFAMAGAQPALKFSESTLSPTKIDIQGHRMLVYILNVIAENMPEDPRENIAEIPPLKVTAMLQNAVATELIAFPAEFDGDMTIASSGVQGSPSEWIVNITTTGGANLIREGTVKTFKFRCDILADPQGGFAEMLVGFNVEPLFFTPSDTGIGRLYLDAKEATSRGGVVGTNIWGTFPDGIIAVAGTIVTDVPLTDVKVTLGSWTHPVPINDDSAIPTPESVGWMIASNVVGNVIRFDAAGNIPLRSGTWAPFNVSFNVPDGVAAVSFTVERAEFNEFDVTSRPPETSVVRIVRPIPAHFEGDGRVIDGGYALPVGGKAVLKLDAKAPGGLTGLIVVGGTDKAEPRLISPEIITKIMPFGGDAEGYHFEGWGEWVADPAFDGIIGLVLSFRYESGPLEISGPAGEILQSLIVIVPKYGDGNGDGVVKVKDAVLAVHHGGTSAQNKALDVSGNGFVGAYDAALILQCVVGLIDTFPVERPKVQESPSATPVPESKLLQEALKALQQKAPATLEEFEKVGGSLDALAGVNPKGKLSATWAGLKSAR